jgi:hypothetical protein
MIQKQTIYLGPSDNGHVYLVVDKNGSYAALARPREGKSATIKSILSQIKKRRVLIIDPHSEYKLSTQPNFNSKNPGRLKAKEIKNFAIPITEYDTDSFLSLGFTEKAAIQLPTWIKKKEEKHNNSPKKIALMFMKSSRQDPIFHADTDASIARIMKMLIQQKYFYEPGEERKPLDDIGPELAKQNIILNLEMKSMGRDHNERMRATVGILLRNLNEKGWIRKLNPIIVVDEADKLAPRNETSQATYMLRELTLKLQKDNVVMFYISQNFNLVDRALVENVKGLILGKFSHDRYDQYTKKLKFNPRQGKREFLFIDQNYHMHIFNAGYDEPRCIA